MSSGPTLLVDVGSTVVKVCVHGDARGFDEVETIPRRLDISPGEQVRALVEERRRCAHIPGLRVCSSANGGVRVGVLGLSRRHSVAAAARAAVASGGNVVYERLLGDRTCGPAPPIDLLVLVGGVDGADHRYLRAAIAKARLGDFAREVLVWAGADAPDIVAGLPVDHVVANVLDQHLRPTMQGLADMIHHIYLSDLVDRKGLQALAGITDTPIWPTPAVLGLAAERMGPERMGPERMGPERMGPERIAAAPVAPFVIIDVGGATTDVLYCAELRAEDTARVSPGESIVRQVFTDLGVASSLPALQHRLATDPGLFETVDAIAPERSRALYHDICEGVAGSLAPPTSFLACLFLALQRLTDPAGLHRIELSRATSFVITGGAWTGTPMPAIRRVIGAACGMPNSGWSLLADRPYVLWAYGLLAVPAGAQTGVPSPEHRPEFSPGRSRGWGAASVQPR
jgi:MutL protein